MAFCKTYPHPPVMIADVGTGSGCIAVTLAKVINNCRIIATDISARALDVALRNARQHGVHTQIQYIQTNLLFGVNKRFDLICANLPYIPSNVLAKLPVADHEPRLALDGGPDGCLTIRQLIQNLANVMHEKSAAIFEIEHTLGPTFLEMCKTYHPRSSSKIVDDLTGLPRFGVIRFDE